jgi:transposase, IS30 family
MAFEIRESRVPQGRKPLRKERAEYFRLVNLGYSSQDACQMVGVNFRTGKRWRNGANPTAGHVGAPPVAVAHRSSPSGRYLDEADRIHIADRRREKASLRTIAAELGRSPSTISREVRRNSRPGGGAYRPHAAQARADARRPRPKPGRFTGNPQLRDLVQSGLERKWSPEQISQDLRRRFPDQPEMQVCHETIYRALYVQGRGELRRELVKALRTGRARRKPRRQAQQRQSRYATPMVMISDRPAEVDDRAVPGHWEGDLIIGRQLKSAIGTLVERTTRYLLLVHLPHGRTAEHMHDALLETITTLPGHLKRSLTWDQGSEMGLHHQFSLAADMPVYFCNPASPWQRGTNENTNGLLRQYFPRGTDLALHTRTDLDAIATELNARPRKTLGWQTPAERLARLLAPTS